MARKNKTDKRENTLLIIAVLVLVLLSSLWWGFGYMGGMMFFGPMFMVLVLVLIVWLIVSLIRAGDDR